MYFALLKKVLAELFPAFLISPGEEEELTC